MYSGWYGVRGPDSFRHVIYGDFQRSNAGNIRLYQRRSLNSLAAAYIGEVGMEVIMKLLLLRFIHSFVNNLVRNINRIVTRIYGELVVQHIKRMIMDKARTIDLASFDDPEFYSRLENANNEAGQRPIQILELPSPS